MKTQLKYLSLLGALTLALSWNTLALAEGDNSIEHYKKFSEKKHQMMKEVIDELGLNEEQLAQIEQERNASFDKKKQLREQLDAKEKDLKAQLKESEIDKTKIDQTVTEISDLKAQKLRDHVDSILAIRAILTPEQYVQFQEKMEAKKEEKRELFKMKRQPLNESPDSHHKTL